MSEQLPVYSFGICGSTGPDPRFNPSLVLKEPTAQAIVRLLNEGPRSPAELALLAPDLAARIEASRRAEPAFGGDVSRFPFEEAFRRVVDLRAAVQRGPLWHIGFPLLTAADEETLRSSLEPFARALAELVLAARETIGSALAGVSWHRPLPEVRLAVVGCMALDWGALALLDRAGITHPGRKYPDGGQFTILGRGRDTHSPPGMYCSSHTSRGARYSFTGFGDNSGPRQGLPDALWLLESAARKAILDLPEEITRALSGVASAQRAAVIDSAGEALASASSSPEEAGGALASPGRAGGVRDEIGTAVRGLLSALGYLAPGGPQVLLLRAAHSPAIQAAVGETLSLVDPWVSANREGIVGAAAETSPARNGVDPGMFFVELWHDVFGAANRIMTEEGWLSDPAPPTPGEARYITWCAENALYDRLQEWLRGGSGRAPR
jgi:hypothetical protein